MARRGSFERSVFARDQAGNLTTPAVSQDRPLFDTAVRFLGIFKDARNLRQGLVGASLGLEEFTQLLALLVVVRWVPSNVRRLALEEVGNKDLILVFLVGVSEDVGALNGLREESEDIIDNKDGPFGIGGAGSV